tara:strand:- start:343 stop:1032 length:690 start_codon:yes stop_codon:yes gene_type:complete
MNPSFEQEERDLSLNNPIYLEESTDYRQFIVNRTMFHTNNYTYISVYDKENIFNFGCKTIFRKKKQKNDVFLNHSRIGQLIKNNNIFEFFINNEIIPHIIIKYKINNNGPASCSVLLPNRYTTQESINEFKKNDLRYSLADKYPHGDYLIHKKPQRRTYNSGYFLKFKQRDIKSSRKNVSIDTPYQIDSYSTQLELCKVNSSDKISVISRNNMNPLRSAVFSFAWLTIL